VLARQTKKARLLALGVPTTNRMDPFRLAEEFALIDVMSRGRLEIGLVKGTAWELFISNQNPARLMDRFWEAHDVIIKGLTTLDGPFSWEGEYFNYRHVNVWPRCWQQPHPPIWIPTSGPTTARKIAEFGYVMAVFMAGFHTKGVFNAYRESYLKAHGRIPGFDRYAYLAMAVVGNSDREARERAEKMRLYLATLPRVMPGTTNPAGYTPIGDNVRLLSAGAGGGGRWKGSMIDGRPLPDQPTLEDLAAAGILFFGTPDQVVRQISDFFHAVGGFGHLLMEGQAGTLDHAETVNSLTLFAKEVYPRLKELTTVDPESLIGRNNDQANGGVVEEANRRIV
jgi:alkanesulfonate monooxygenase SsuD/methylene tetrahydromethanopterin reductase-like flavin-dependent oxidoreductase (luciferase family)